MLIGISGTPFSGKTEIIKYLQKLGFEFVDFKAKHETKDKLHNNAHTLARDTVFSTIEELMDHVTLNWRKNFVMVSIKGLNDLELLAKRPFFLHISIDAPSKTRYSRYLAQKGESTFEDFMEKSDNETFLTELSQVMERSQIKLINNGVLLKQLNDRLDALNLTDITRLRPSWDSYFMKLADLAALRSNCMKRRVGCVIMRESRVIATGYNGTPRHMTNCNEGGCSRCNTNSTGLSTCLCLHAEENALLESGRDRIGTNATLYCNTCPCLTCSIKIVQSGIKEVVYSQSYNMDELSAAVFKEAGVQLRQFTPPTTGTFVL
ncbi:unnamed protein product [Kuraishia capsulata CBS 1993]|uniref:Deoxycytidylate deaminase n=1 Tax=Kuraishia capsulata CBS 1993 TaxID=1382522 RepID=W6MFC2_9ASCO|nr:uncharacterized protein KUCA_T00000171001 [Kuraishia capsulata CBS 1993]CDK24211.1 unnamed protein product [Kuraishia capsulata CBS 1993]